MDKSEVIEGQPGNSEVKLSSAPQLLPNQAFLRDECTGTCVTFWTGDVRYKSLAELRALIEVMAGLCRCF